MGRFLEWLDTAARVREQDGLRRVAAPARGDLLDLAGNDYLGLRRHPAVVAGAVAAAREHGGGAGASRLVTGTLPVHEELEAALASLTGAPSALVLSTGYHANLAAVTALADRDTLIVSDAHVHASLVDAARLCRAEVAVARHQDVAHVEQLLLGRGRRRAIVLVESIYSVLGDAAPLTALADLTRRHDAVLVVDDAHGLGVVGEHGEGVPGLLGLSGREDVVVTATLSKSLGAQGGVVLAHAAVREHLVNTARPFVYDTGLAPACAGAALAALQVLSLEPQRAARARAAAAVLARALERPAPPGAVLSVSVAGPREALRAVEEAAAEGVRIGCFRPPSSPDGSSRLRLTAHADHQPAELERAAEVLVAVTRSHGAMARG